VNPEKGPVPGGFSPWYRALIFRLIEIIMGTTGKVEIALHLDKGLIDQLEKEAKRENKSLNGYVEKMLRKLIRRQPNPETMEAIREARENDNLEVLDVDHFKEFVASL